MRCDGLGEMTQRSMLQKRRIQVTRAVLDSSVQLTMRTTLPVILIFQADIPIATQFYLYRLLSPSQAICIKIYSLTNPLTAFCCSRFLSWPTLPWIIITFPQHDLWLRISNLQGFLPGRLDWFGVKTQKTASWERFHSVWEIMSLMRIRNLLHTEC